ncbi:MAG: cyanophycinase, partial [Acidobacteria bacterium]|nr:cyanophycinase [Acidobacteriota bacterium]
MSTKKGIIVFATIVLLSLSTSSIRAAEVGPSKGSLVIVGGGIRDLGILKRFIELAGGPESPIVVIPTAGGQPDYDHTWAPLRLFREAGARNVTLLHTYDPKVADSEEFIAPLRRAAGVFFWEGRQWRIADAYLNTRAHKEFNAVLARGGVIGGSSAGASIQGSFLMRGDTKTSDILIGDHQQGLGFLRNVAIDQHVLVRNRQFDMVEVVKAFPNLLGLAIDENTAIVVRQDEFEVIGNSYV